MQRLLSIMPWAATLGILLLVMGGQVSSAQSARSTNSLDPNLQTVAGPYPIRDIEFFGRDSVRIDVEDSSRTVRAVRAHAWMFGPPVTVEEAGGCPLEKVLGRRIARELWRREGRAMALEQVIVRVHGNSGLDRLSYEDMYYGRADLDTPWVGDRVHMPGAQRQHSTSPTR